MAKPRVYLETSFVSYLVARTSRDLVVAAQQQVTEDWWINQRSKYSLHVSELVIEEAAVGDSQKAKRRLAAVSDLPILFIDAAVIDLAEAFVKGKAIPPVANADALHLAVATVNQMDYLLTWNYKHLANAALEKKVIEISIAFGYESVVVCTPHELTGEELNDE